VATRALLAGISVYFAMSWIAGGYDDLAVLLAFGANFGPLVAAGDLWRLVASIFLHGDPYHILVNGLILYVLGRRVEAFYGAWTTAAIFVISGVVGSIASATFSTTISVGASGGIHGLIGTAVAFAIRNPRLLRRPFRWRMGLLLFGALVVDIVIGTVWQRVDVLAHLGGLAAGLVMGWRLEPAALVEARGLVPRPPRLLASFTVSLLLVSFASAGVNLFRLRGDEGAILDPRALAILTEVNRAEAMEAVQSQLDQSPDDPALLMMRGTIHTIGEEWDEAIRDYERVLAVAPDDPGARNNLAWLLLEELPPERRDIARATELARAASEADPADPYARGTWATALLRGGDAAAAIPEFERALGVSRPASEEATDRYLLAIALFRVGRGEEARECLRRAIRQDEDNDYRSEAESALGETIHSAPAP
jgi:rhomboid protease GluP